MVSEEFFFLNASNLTCCYPQIISIIFNSDNSSALNHMSLNIKAEQHSKFRFFISVFLFVTSIVNFENFHVQFLIEFHNVESQMLTNNCLSISHNFWTWFNFAYSYKKVRVINASICSIMKSLAFDSIRKRILRCN
jgi:hypothetical protein